MTPLLHTAAVEGIRFFGRISASVSHELKNSLSIMNESAGLLEDLSLLAEKGKPLDAARVKRLSGMIRSQIQRTDQIIRNMNRFSHAVDDPFKQIDLYEFLTLVLAISRRLTEARGVIVELASPPPKVISVTTRPFFLHHLIWRIIEFGMDAVGKSGIIGLGLSRTGEGVELIFSNLDNLSDGPPATKTQEKAFPETQDETLITLLGVRVDVDEAHQQIRLQIPERLEQ
jgi:signal transduction histidine kinase